jgi:RNA polymerase sigma-70 factor (ECF subfamily)
MTAVSPSTGQDTRLAFEQAALPHMAALHRTARRLARQPEDAADLLQETFLRAFRTFGNFRPGSNARAWLFTILHSVFVNRYHRAQLEPEAVDPGDLDARFAAVVSPPHDAVVEAMRNAMPPEVDAALRTLPEAFREVVLLVDVEELTYEEAALAVGCPVGTLRSRLFRGRKALVVALADYARRQGFATGREGTP